MTRTPSPHPDDSLIACPPRELDGRVCDGIHVQLLWHPADGHLSVAVEDSKTGETFELDVCHGQHALDVFRHPYAYITEPPARERLAAQFAHYELGLDHELGSST